MTGDCHVRICEKLGLKCACLLDSPPHSPFSAHVSPEKSGQAMQSHVYGYWTLGNYGVQKIMARAKQRGDLNSGHLTQAELHLYGSSQLGIFNINRDMVNPVYL
jgi:hypothetical protein